MEDDSLRSPWGRVLLVMSTACDPKVAAARGGLSVIKQSIGRVRFLGVGTGRTVEAFLRESVDELAGKVVVVPSSLDTAVKAAKLGFTVIDPRSAPQIDIYVDGADEAVASTGDLLKGGGGALLGEKILAYSSPVNIIILDYSKVVERLASTRGIPVEVVSGFAEPVKRSIERLGLKVEYRSGSGKRGPVISDWGGVILDVYVEGGVENPGDLDSVISSLPGVAATGLFHGLTDYLVIGESSCSTEIVRYKRGM